MECRLRLLVLSNTPLAGAEHNPREVRASFHLPNLSQADVNVKFVKEMRDNIKKVVNFDDLAAGHNKRRIIQQVRLVVLQMLPTNFYALLISALILCDIKGDDPE